MELGREGRLNLFHERGDGDLLWTLWFTIAAGDAGRGARSFLEEVEVGKARVAGTVVDDAIVVEGEVPGNVDA